MHPTFWAVLNTRRANAAIVYLSNATYDKTVIDPADATASISFNSTRATVVLSDNPALDPFWLSEGLTSGYDIRVTISTGTFSTGSDATATWLNLSTNRLWKVDRTVLGLKACTATYEIRDAVTLVVKGTASITLSATVDV